MRDFGIIAASFSSSSIGAKRIALVPSRLGQARVCGTGMLGASL